MQQQTYQTHISARCKSSQGEEEMFSASHGRSLRGKYYSVPAHQKQRAREKAVLDCRAFFGTVEFGKACLETSKGSLCAQLYRKPNTLTSVKTNCKIKVFKLFFSSIERIKRSLKCLLKLRDKSCSRNIVKILFLNIFK